MLTRPEDEVTAICQALLRIDTTNYGDNSGPGERAAAECVVELLDEVGLVPRLYEGEEGRSNVVLRVEGEDRSRAGLVIHGHLDVVPATPTDWQVDPFSGEERDGCLWGRGAVDMKDMLAMMVANLRSIARTGARPPRDIVFCFFADEEAGGRTGARWLVEKHPEVFEGCTEALSEVGGFSVHMTSRDSGARLPTYLLQTAEKGVLWLRLVSRGVAGHGSVAQTENAVARLCQAVARIEAHDWPDELIPSVHDLLLGTSDITGVPFVSENLRPLLEQLGGARHFVDSTLRDVANPTMLEAGYKHNVVPQLASAALDCRFLPGHEDAMLKTITQLAGEFVSVEVVHRDVSLEADFGSPLVARMRESLESEDPGCRVLPYCLSGGTDNKHLSRLGIAGYGFVPLRLPDGFDFARMFHGVDERVPVEALKFGTRVMKRLIETC